MRIVFAGSPEFAVPVLEKLTESGKNVVAVITQPDKPKGRKKILTPTPVKECAQKLNIPVFDFVRIRDNVAALKNISADIMITCAYGQILTEEVLGCFHKGVWNIHASLLPLFRGASPIQSAILAGETYTGVTVMKTELSLDTGDMLLVKRCETGIKTAGELSAELSRLGAEAAVEAVELLEKGNVQLLLQDDTKATYCKKLNKEDGKIDFSLSPLNICRLVRAFSPSPAAYCIHAGNILNLLNAMECDIKDGKCGEVVFADKRGIGVKCAESGIIITELQPSGGKPMRAADYVNGRKIKAGDILE